MTAHVFPVGHYLGPHYRRGSGEPIAEPATEPVGHRVRIGPSLRWLRTEPELLAWTLAHGLGELADDDAPPTRATLIGQAWRLAGVDVAHAIGQLVDRRLLVEVDPDGDEAAGFAKSHRLRPLMLALGSDPEEPDAVLLGVAGEASVALSARGHAVWHTARDAATLWDTCRQVAATNPADSDAGTLLPELLEELPGLLGAGVGYLDAVEAERS